MALPAEYTVYNAIILCGVIDPTYFNGSTKAERIAIEIFDDEFQSCIDKTVKELDEDLKSYSSITVANGQIRLTPGIKRNIRGFIQWCRDKIRVEENPAIVAFPINEIPNHIRKYKTHEAFIKMSSTMVDFVRTKQISPKKNQHVMEN